MTTPGFEIVFDMESGASIRASEAGEGMLLVLALLVMLHSVGRQCLILLDGVHEGLHPRTQMELLNMLDDLVKQSDGLQIIMTTHSPYVVNRIPPESVLVFAQRPDGTSAVKPLSEHPDIERVRGRLSSGQLWTLDNEEDWVCGSVR